MYIAAITHDIKSNTLEVTWLEEIKEGDLVVEFKRVKCRNYSAEQKEEFESDVQGGIKYTAMAGW